LLPELSLPACVFGRLANEIGVVRVQVGALPFALLRVSVAAGHRFVAPEECGRAALLADLLAEGSRRLDGNALQRELDQLGATLDVGVDDDEISLELAVLARHQERGVALLLELLLDPRFAAEDFARVQRQRLAELALRRSDARALAEDAWRAALFGAQSASGAPPVGTPESIAGLTRDRLEASWRAALVARGVRVTAVGPPPPDRGRDAFDALLQALEPLGELTRGDAPAPAASVALAPADGLRDLRVTLVDRPRAPQTEIRLGHRSLPLADPDFYRLVALNHPLGGAFSSRLNRNLRETKGYTYGVRSGFSGGLANGWFQVATAVESGVTRAALEEILAELERFRDGGPLPEEVESTRNALSATFFGQYESARSKAAFASNVGKYGWPADYPERRRRWLLGMSKAELDGLARRHLAAAGLELVCVGDRERLERDLVGLARPAWGLYSPPAAG
jgi:zinc protease